MTTLIYKRKHEPAEGSEVGEKVRCNLLHEALDLWRAIVRPELRITGVPLPEVEDILILKIMVDLHNTETCFCQAFLKEIVQ